MAKSDKIPSVAISGKPSKLIVNPLYPQQKSQKPQPPFESRLQAVIILFAAPPLAWGPGQAAPPCPKSLKAGSPVHDQGRNEAGLRILMPQYISSPEQLFGWLAEIGERANFRKSELLLASSQANFMRLNYDAKKWGPASFSTPHIRPDSP